MVRLANKAPDESPAEQPEQDTPAAPKRHRRWWKYPLLLIFTAMFLGSGWFTYKVAAASNKIFAENTTGGSPLLRGKKAKNESQERVNILLIGIGGAGHDGPNLTDTIQVASIDPKSKHISMLSLPRDLYVKVPDSYQKVKLNEVHSIGEENGARGGGPGLDKQLLSDMLDIPIHYFVRVDFSGFKQMVDAVGGVDVDVSQRLYDPYYPRGESTGYQIVDIPAGRQHLDGETALEYSRSRETTSDFDRSRRQQEVLSAVRDKALSFGFLTNPAKISAMISTLGDHVKTDLSISEMERLSRIVKDIPQANITSKVIDNGADPSQGGLLYDSIGPSGAYILLPKAGDYSEVRQFANAYLTGQSVTNEQPKIEVQNASGRAGLAKQLADSLAASGYTVTGITNAPNLAQTTVVYDFTGGKKPASINLLKKRLNDPQVITQQGDGSIDIRVVIGSDYSDSTQSQYGGGAR